MDQNSERLSLGRRWSEARPTKTLVSCLCTLIVVARDQASFYEFLRPRQEATGRARVVLDRRLADRRSGAVTASLERRKGERRAPTPAARALMTVLGFMVLHPGEERALQPGVTGA